MSIKKKLFSSGAVISLSALVISGTALFSPEDALASYTNDFIQSSVSAAQASQKDWKVPASVTLAQAILESGWGRSGLSLPPHNNYFGIKCTNWKSPYQKGCVNMRTSEYYDGKYVKITDGFRTYASKEDSFKDHARFLASLPHYGKAFNYPNDPKQFIREVAKGGYATSPTYADDLIAIMDQYNLYQYDKLPSKSEKPKPTASKTVTPTQTPSSAPQKPASPAPAKSEKPKPTATPTSTPSPAPKQGVATPVSNNAAVKAEESKAADTAATQSSATPSAAPAGTPAASAKPVPTPTTAPKISKPESTPQAKAETSPEANTEKPVVEKIPEEQLAEEFAADRAEVFFTPQNFLDTAMPTVEKLAKKYQVAPQVLLAAAAYHSDFGNSLAAQAGNNFMGLECSDADKAHKDDKADAKKATCVKVLKTESVSGTAFKTSSWTSYKSYSNIEEALTDYLENGGRGTEVPKEMIDALANLTH